MEIRNKKNYFQYISFISLLLLIGFIIIWSFKRQSIALLTILFVAIETFIIAKKFTYKISISTDQIQITFYQWLMKRILTLNAKEIKTQVGFTIGNRGYKYKTLNFNLENKLVYSFSTNDGFSDEDLELIAKKLNSTDM
jgi:hypothetical protein